MTRAVAPVRSGLDDAAWMRAAMEREAARWAERRGASAYETLDEDEREAVVASWRLEAVREWVRSGRGQSCDWYERLLGARVVVDGARLRVVDSNGVGAGRTRKRDGIFYTPPALVSRVLNAALPRHGTGPWRVFDPACGTGNFLAAALERAPAGAQLVGVDVDPAAVELCRWRLNRGGGGTETIVQCGDGLVDSDEVRAGTFDAVVGNPPFVDSEAMARRRPGERRRLVARFATARGNWDLACVFVERAIQLVRPGGRVALVLPRRLLCARYGAAMRRYVLDHARSMAIDVRRTDESFDATDEPVVVLSLTRAEPGEDRTVRIVDDAGTREVGRRLLSESVEMGWSVLIQGGAPIALTRADGWRLEELADVGDGATTAEAYEIAELIREWDGREALGEEVFALVNTGTIDPGVCLWDRRPTRYLGRRFEKPVVEAASLAARFPRRYVQARASKVLVAGLSRRVEAAADARGEWLCGKSATRVEPRDASVDLESLARWLNSDEFTAWFRAAFGGRGFGGRTLCVAAPALRRAFVPRWAIERTASGAAGR